MERILFIGDSITDAERLKTSFTDMGKGYANYVKATLGAENPEKYEFLNRGISGNRIVDLYARIKADFINLAPDIASIYVGVNDVWHEIMYNNGVSTDKFEKIYTMFIEEIYEALPNIKLMLIAPFVLKGIKTCDTEEIPDKLSRFIKDVREKNEATKRISEKFSLPCIDLQAEFDKLKEVAPDDYWTVDGVHPTEMGHEIIKNLWLDTFSKI